METGESVNALPPAPPEQCPICGKAPHPERTTSDKKNDKGCLTSKPQNLGCSQLPMIPGVPNYATAAHHLIPANQCLKQFIRLSQMCKTVGYDVNNTNNGIALPTCGQGSLNAYDHPGGTQEKYGKLDDADKKNAAFLIMEALNLQWHVGHHDWNMDFETDAIPHVENYDKLVKTKLRDLESDIEKSGKEICEPEDDSESGSAIIGELNALSQEIKGFVVAWKTYYVSAMSCKFAAKYR